MLTLFEVHPSLGVVAAYETTSAAWQRNARKAWQFIYRCARESAHAESTLHVFRPNCNEGHKAIIDLAVVRAGA